MGFRTVIFVTKGGSTKFAVVWSHTRLPTRRGPVADGGVGASETSEATRVSARPSPGWRKASREIVSPEVKAGHTAATSSRVAITCRGRRQTVAKSRRRPMRNWPIRSVPHAAQSTRHATRKQLGGGVLSTLATRRQGPMGPGCAPYRTRLIIEMQDTRSSSSRKQNPRATHGRGPHTRRRYPLGGSVGTQRRDWSHCGDACCPHVGYMDLRKKKKTRREGPAAPAGGPSRGRKS